MSLAPWFWYLVAGSLLVIAARVAVRRWREVRTARRWWAGRAS